MSFPESQNQAAQAHPYFQITLKAFNAREQRQSRHPYAFISENTAPSHGGQHNLFSFDTAALSTTR